MSDMKRHEDVAVVTSSEITNLDRIHWLARGWTRSRLHSRIPSLEFLYNPTDGTQWNDQINISVKRVIIRSTLEFLGLAVVRSEEGGRTQGLADSSVDSTLQFRYRIGYVIAVATPNPIDNDIELYVYHSNFVLTRRITPPFVCNG